MNKQYWRVEIRVDPDGRGQRWVRYEDTVYATEDDCVALAFRRLSPSPGTKTKVSYWVGRE